MFERILVICTCNICRSPLAAALLTRGLVEKKGSASVQSAGVAALTGHAAEETVSRIAAEHGISLADHCATQISIDATRQAELILAMEQRHIDAVLAFDPTARGKTFLLGHWSSREIADPYRQEEAAYRHAHAQIAETTGEWLARL